MVGVHDPVKGEQGLSSLRTSVGKFGLEFPVLAAEEATQDAYGITGIPTRVLVDREGKVVFREVGFDDEMAPALERRLREALK